VQVGTAVRSLSCATDGSMVVAANNSGTCYVWRLQRGTQGSATHFEPFHKLAAHNAYILKCLISPDGRYVQGLERVSITVCAIDRASEIVQRPTRHAPTGRPISYAGIW
jgi:WD40 repeat protein